MLLTGRHTMFQILLNLIAHPTPPTSELPRLCSIFLCFCFSPEYDRPGYLGVKSQVFYYFLSLLRHFSLSPPSPLLQSPPTPRQSPPPPLLPPPPRLHTHTLLSLSFPFQSSSLMLLYSFQLFFFIIRPKHERFKRTLI